MPTRQERRAKLKAEMARVIARGVEAAGAPERWWWAVAAETRYLIDIFRSGGKKRASDAAKHAHEFFERSVKSNNPGGSIDCAKGCFMCCTLYVSATAPEVFLVAEYLRNETPERFNEILERVRAVDRDTRYMDDRARLPTRIRCPLLGSDDACVAYSVRPSACRGFVSSSLEACKRGYAGNGNETIPRPPMWWQIRGAQNFAVEAAMIESGLPPTHYSFANALRIAMENPDAEERWLKGEHVFANVMPDSFEADNSPQVRAARVAALIAAAMAQEVPDSGIEPAGKALNSL